MAVAIALLIVCIAGATICNFIQLAITAEMEMRMGDPPNLTFWKLAARGRSLQIEREFRRRFPGDRLIRRMYVVKAVFFTCVAGGFLAFLVVSFTLPQGAPASR